MAEVTTTNYVAKIKDLLPSEENPRSIGRKEYDLLKKSLVEFPEMKQLREIIVDEHLQILAGHQRIYALKDLGYEDVYVRQVKGLSKKQKREFMVKDNLSSGKWDSDIIANQWDLDEIQSFGLPEFKIPGSGGDPGNDNGGGNSKEVTCPDCGHSFNPKDTT
jgi:hypothetical protein